MAKLIILIILTMPYSGGYIASGQIVQPQKTMKVCQSMASSINMQGGGHRLQRQKLGVMVVARCKKNG